MAFKSLFSANIFLPLFPPVNVWKMFSIITFAPNNNDKFYLLSSPKKKDNIINTFSNSAI